MSSTCGVRKIMPCWLTSIWRCHTSMISPFRAKQQQSPAFERGFFFGQFPPKYILQICARVARREAPANIADKKVKQRPRRDHHKHADKAPKHVLFAVLL